MMFKFALATTLLITTQAQATEILFGNRATFNAVLGKSVTDDYSNPSYTSFMSNAAMSDVIGETDYESTGFLPNEVNIVSFGYYCAGCNGSFNLRFSSTSVTEGNGVFGVGFDFFNRDGFHDALVIFGDGESQLFSLIGKVEALPETFWGITSTRQISLIAFGPNGASTTVGDFGIDNLTIGNAVPEFATWAMLVIGFGFVGATSRRRRSALI